MVHLFQKFDKKCIYHATKFERYSLYTNGETKRETNSDCKEIKKKLKWDFVSFSVFPNVCHITDHFFFRMLDCLFSNLSWPFAPYFGMKAPEGQEQYMFLGRFISISTNVYKDKQSIISVSGYWVHTGSTLAYQMSYWVTYRKYVVLLKNPLVCLVILVHAMPL